MTVGNVSCVGEWWAASFSFCTSVRVLNGVFFFSSGVVTKQCYRRFRRGSLLLSKSSIKL